MYRVVEGTFPAAAALTNPIDAHVSMRVHTRREMHPVHASRSREHAGGPVTLC